MEYGNKFIEDCDIHRHFMLSVFHALVIWWNEGWTHPQNENVAKTHPSPGVRGGLVPSVLGPRVRLQHSAIVTQYIQYSKYISQLLSSIQTPREAKYRGLSDMSLLKNTQSRLLTITSFDSMTFIVSRNTSIIACFNLSSARSRTHMSYMDVAGNSLLLLPIDMKNMWLIGHTHDVNILYVLRCCNRTTFRIRGYARLLYLAVTITLCCVANQTIKLAPQHI